MRIWNLTPHTIVVQLADGISRHIESDGVLRIEQHSEPAAPLDGLPTVTISYGDASGLPAEVRAGDALIVSIVAAPVLVAQNSTTHDRPYLVLTPDTGPTCVRDEQGRIAAVRQLIRWS